MGWADLSGQNRGRWLRHFRLLCGNASTRFWTAHDLEVCCVWVVGEYKELFFVKIWSIKGEAQHRLPGWLELDQFSRCRYYSRRCCCSGPVASLPVSGLVEQWHGPLAWGGRRPSQRPSWAGRGALEAEHQNPTLTQNWSPILPLSSPPTGRVWQVHDVPHVSQLLFSERASERDAHGPLEQAHWLRPAPLQCRESR
jgi:hypothetical protein